MNYYSEIYIAEKQLDLLTIRAWPHILFRHLIFLYTKKIETKTKNKNATNVQKWLKMVAFENVV